MIPTTDSLNDCDSVDNSVWVAIWDGTNTTLISRGCFLCTKSNSEWKGALQISQQLFSGCYTRANMRVYIALASTHFCACVELKYTNHFSALRQEIKGIWVTQKPFVHLWATPKVSFNNKGWMLFSMWWFKKKKKKSEGDMNRGIITKNDPVLTCWGGRDELELECWCWLNSTAHSFLYLAGIPLPHFNSHSSLKSPLRCRSHFLWFVF